MSIIVSIAAIMLHSLERIVELHAVFVAHLKYLTSSNVLHTCTYGEERRSKITLHVISQIGTTGMAV